ncbi:hypothetical protein [Clostridium sp.]|nr:hypothetical protein [Clostridium sp.]
MKCYGVNDVNGEMYNNIDNISGQVLFANTTGVLVKEERLNLIV